MADISPIHSPLPADSRIGAVHSQDVATRLVQGLRGFYKAMRNRVAARALEELTDRELADIGLSRHDLVAGFRKPRQLDPTIEFASRARANTRAMRG
jgi:Domain of unknown function (DUF1127).